MARIVAEGSKLCPYCAEEIRAEAIKCRYCGEKLDVAVPDDPPPPAPPAPPDPPLDPFEPVVPVTLAAPVEPAELHFGVQPGNLPRTIYDPGFDLDTLPKSTRTAAMGHTLDRRVPVWAAVLASIATLNFFFLLNYSVKHGRLPKLVANDPSPVLAALLLFVPGVNAYWVFFCWVRLCDRLNFQLKLRGLPAGPNRWLPVWSLIILIVGYLFAASAMDVWIFAWSLNWLVLVPLFVAQLQRAINTLVDADAAK